MPIDPYTALNAMLRAEVTRCAPPVRRSQPVEQSEPVEQTGHADPAASPKTPAAAAADPAA
ncbi:hypothetical protein AB0892_21480 [Streptomyces sp. NPDC005409]|uniref:hypothetical protein n=1 Tax=Streptomyces sp. NPDC005409 TaxID=3155342 RepID=UPI0034544564